MIQNITGIIASATPIEQIKRKDGTHTIKAVLHIQECTTDPHPQEVAVSVTGPWAQYAGMVGQMVEVEYVVRVFSFTKGNKPGIGNDIYACHIRPLSNQIYNPKTNKK